MASVLRRICSTVRAAGSSATAVSTNPCVLKATLRNYICSSMPRSPRRRPLLYLGLLGFGTASGVASHQAVTAKSGDPGQHAEFLPSIAPELQMLFIALLLAARDNDDSQDLPSPEHALYTVREMPRKGQGAIASASIPRGTVIASERPLVVWPTQLDAERAQQLYNYLGPEAQQAYSSLANAAEPDSSLHPVLGVRATNGFSVELPPVSDSFTHASLQPSIPSTASFVFPRIARINHSCLPNADHSIDWVKLRMTVYATTVIPAGDEICIEYTSALVQSTRDERRALLKRDFGFTCYCQACSLESDALQQSDERRGQVNTIVEVLREGQLPRNQMMKAFEKLELLLAEEGYKAYPEFSDPKVSNAYVGYKTIKQRREAVQSDV